MTWVTISCCQWLIHGLWLQGPLDSAKSAHGLVTSAAHRALLASGQTCPFAAWQGVVRIPPQRSLGIPSLLLWWAQVPLVQLLRCRVTVESVYGCGRCAHPEEEEHFAMGTNAHSFWLSWHGRGTTGVLVGPTPLANIDPECPLSRRFGIQQQAKIRCINDFSWSSL